MTKPDRDHIARFFAFHHWATDRAFDGLAPLSAADLDRQWGGSFKTARAMLNHVLGVERVWHARVSGESPKALPPFPAEWGGREFQGEWQKIKADERRYVDGLTSQQIANDLTYTNFKGETLSWPLADVFFHWVNHGTYHRGQITQLLRDLGRDAPSTDFTVYLVEEKKRG